MSPSLFLQGPGFVWNQISCAWLLAVGQCFLLTCLSGNVQVLQDNKFQLRSCLPQEALCDHCGLDSLSRLNPIISTLMSVGKRRQVSLQHAPSICFSITHGCFGETVAESCQRPHEQQAWSTCFLFSYRKFANPWPKRGGVSTFQYDLQSMFFILQNSHFKFSLVF